MLAKIKSFIVNNKAGVAVVIMSLIIGGLTLWMFYSVLNKI